MPATFRLRSASALVLTISLALSLTACARLHLPAVFSDNMILQRDRADPVWGWDAPGAHVSVSIAGQTKTATADANGKWIVQLDPMPATATPLTMTVKGSDTIEIKNILVGEVWMCSGQSNMLFKITDAWNAEVETAAMRHPDIRLITVPNIGSQAPLDDFKGAWTPCTPESAKEFSAVGLFYGRYLHQALGVPVGLINNSWGGASIQSWMKREDIDGDPELEEISGTAGKSEWKATAGRSLKKYEEDLVEYHAELAAWHEELQKNPDADLKRPHRPPDPREFMSGQQRPGNIFNGVLHPTLGYGMKGVLWYQGEANTRNAWLYRKLFPKLITGWRTAWNDDTLRFYWVQLPNYGERKDEPETDAAWAELRESQTKTLALPRTGQCVTIDIGEGNDLHPKNKLDIAARLARWALANDYGFSMPYRSPEFKAMSIAGNKASITFSFPGSGLCTERSDDVRGFTICGADKAWKNAKARIIDDSAGVVEVSNDAIQQPVAVRYAWADNPDCNLYTKDGLPVTPFRTDDFPLSTQPQAK
jgi:sialate O-acetylesterase